MPEKALPRGKDPRSRIELAIGLLHRIKHYINKELIVVADGLYAKAKLVKFCIKNDITFISRLRSDAGLYEEPSPRKGPGRPRKYGARLPKLNQMAADKEGFKKYTLKLYGELHHFEIKSFEAMWKPAATVIKVLMVYFDDAKTANYFFSTNLSLPALALKPYSVI